MRKNKTEHITKKKSKEPELDLTTLSIYDLDMVLHNALDKDNHAMIRAVYNEYERRGVGSPQ